MFSKGSPLSSSIQSFPRLIFGPIFSKIQKFCISNLHNLKNNCLSDQEMILQISKVKKNFETGFFVACYWRLFRYWNNENAIWNKLENKFVLIDICNYAIGEFSITHLQSWTR